MGSSARRRRRTERVRSRRTLVPAFAIACIIRSECSTIALVAEPVGDSRNSSVSLEARMSQAQAPAALSALTKDEAWPELPLAAWEDTRATLHMWMQMAGKVALALSPNVNHCWAVALHVSPRGLTTLPLPYPLGI